MDRQFTYAPAVSPLHDPAAVAPLLAALAEALTAAGGAPGSAEEAPLDLPFAHVVLTGGTEGVVLERLRQRGVRAGREPVLLVAHPTHNSLPACLELLARVRLDGGVGRIVFLAGDPEDGERLSEAVQLAGVALALRHARLGALGAPSDWLVASAPEPDAVRAAWGPEIVAIPMRELVVRMAGTAADPELVRGLRAGARATGVAVSELAPASALHRALAALVREQRLTAVTLRCFDLVAGQRTTGCLALSQLADQGIAAGCEGDLPSAVALLWALLLTGRAAWMANPARIAPARGEILLAHCTVPRSLVARYDLETHFESGLGVALGGDLAPGPVTLLRLGGRRLEQIWLAEGELVAAPREASLCRTQARVLTEPARLEELLRAPLGNHVVLLPGHRAERLRASRELILGET